MVSWHQTVIESGTGASLNCYQAFPKKSKAGPKAVVQINHGMSEHSLRYKNFARFLAEHSYAVLIHDHRGHGQTTAPDAPLGNFGTNGGENLLGDIDAINGQIRKLYPGIPIICFGHSMGGVFSMNYALLNPDRINGVAVWNTNLDANIGLKLFKLILLTERMLKGSDVPSTMASTLTFQTWNRKFQPNRTDFDWLSRDEAEVDIYINDSLCGFPLTVGAWLAVVEAIRSGAGKNAIQSLPKTLPFNLVAGGDDPVSENGEAILSLARRLQTAGMTDVTTTIYPKTRHECLHEINRDHIAVEFLDWLDEYFG
ncbi:MAG: alpha/beta fold hydrolase [Rhizobiaceae bacterium]